MTAPPWLRQRLKDAAQDVYAPNGDAIPTIPASGLSQKDLIRLDANENLLFPPSVLSAVLRDVMEEVDVRTYPRLEEARLKEAIGDYLAFPSDQIVVSNGSDPLIESCIQALLRRDEAAISITPTFAMYKIITRNHGFAYQEVPLNDDFSLNIEAVLSSVTTNTVLCFLNSPNNPTGNQFPLAAVKTIIDAFPGFIVIDEAYVDFAPYSLLKLIASSEKVIVLRTFSKAFGLAGLRIGYALSTPAIIGVLNRIQLPFNINKISLIAARKIVAQRDVITQVVAQVKAERSVLFTRMSQISGVTVFPSDANFLLFKTVKNPAQIYRGLLQRGLLIRRFTRLLGRGAFLRVTVGSPAMNSRFTDALTELCEE